MTTETTFKITNAFPEDLAAIQQLLQEYKLDDCDLSVEQFIVCKEEQTLLGFGRIKKHSDCDELSSLGVLPARRKNGIGKMLIQELIKQTTHNIFIVTVIPGYFAKLGFKKTLQFPASMLAKQKDCKLVCGCSLPDVMIYRK